MKGKIMNNHEQKSGKNSLHKALKWAGAVALGLAFTLGSAMSVAAADEIPGEGRDWKATKTPPATTAPTVQPTEKPTATAKPTNSPTEIPTVVITDSPTDEPTEVPTEAIVTEDPTNEPKETKPSAKNTKEPKPSQPDQAPNTGPEGGIDLGGLFTLGAGITSFGIIATGKTVKKRKMRNRYSK